MLILDTDMLSLIQRPSGSVSERLNHRLEEAAEHQLIAVTVISLEEQMRGWLAYLAAARSSERLILGYIRLHAAQNDFSNRTIVDFDEAAAAEYERLNRIKIRIGTMDLRIAAIALAQGATLLSRNLSHFRRVPGLSVEDWCV